MDRRRIATFVLPAIVIAGAVGFHLVIRSRLPETVAIHWGFGGRPDGFADRDTVPILIATFSILVGGLLAAVASVARRSVLGARALAGLPLGIVAFMVTLQTTLTVVQIDVDTAPTLPGWVIPASIVVGLIAGWLAAAVAGPPEPVPSTAAPAPPGMPRRDVAGGRTPVFVGETPPTRALPGVAAAVALLGLALSWFAHWSIGVIFVPIVLVIVASSTYTVTAGPAGVRVAGRVLGFPRVTVPLGQIASVEAGTVDAYAFGGWGIRLGASGESAVITRSGPALVVERTDGAVLRISLDDPEDAVAALGTLLDRRR